jgi:hypothetical protein
VSPVTIRWAGSSVNEAADRHESLLRRGSEPRTSVRD